jgi:oligopeptide transport system permease protein
MATSATDLGARADRPGAPERRARGLWSDAGRRLRRNRAALAGIVFILLLVVIAVAAPLIAPHDPLQIYPGQAYRQAAWVQTPDRPAVSGTWEFPLGTDAVGRDVLSRLVYGTRTSLVVGFIPMLITVFIGTVVGLTAGYVGGAVDNLLMRFTDFVASFPAFLLFIIVMATLRDTPIGRFWNGFLILFAALAIVSWVGVARLVRSQVLSLREKEFVEAARAIGSSNARIVLRHILPNTLGPMIVAGALIIPGAIITEAVLSFLGIGLRPATQALASDGTLSMNSLFPVSWGNMILDGRAAINSQPWLLIAPAIAIALITLAFTFIGDGLRDALDPRSE